MEIDKRIPVTIISGFLGSGKTTFINQILKKNPEKKFALIENEFGVIGVDNQLIEAKTDTIIEMNQGCICCTLNNNLVETLNHLLQNYSFDHLLIETTGVAEPAGVAAPFLLYPLFKEKFHLKNIIVLVDAYNFEDSLKESDLPARQIAYADILIINKLDLITPEKVILLETTLKALNKEATIYFCEQAQVPITEVLQRSSDFEMPIPPHHHHENHHEHHEEHEHPYHSVYVEIQEPLNLLKFQHWMNMMLQIQSGRIYRIKGWVQFQGFDYPLLFQSVGKQFVLDKKPSENQPKITRLVFIGLGLEKKKIEDILNKLQ